MQLLPGYLEDLVNSKSITKEEMTKGMSKFLKVIPDLSNDCPKIPVYLSVTLFTLIELNAIIVADLVWYEAPVDEDDMVMVEQYYHLMAALLKLKYDKEQKWDGVIDFFKSTSLNKTFKDMQQHILEDNLFADIVEGQKDKKAAKVIVALLKGDETELN